MFFKVLAAIMATVVAYFVFDNGLDYEQALMFVLLPAVAVFSCVMLGFDS